jgi:phage terminase large subunit-like protein
MNSLAFWLALLPEPEKLATLNQLNRTQIRALRYNWQFWARPSQLAPSGDWFTWLIRAGRGFGKTRTGAEWVINRVKNGYKRIALVGQTKADVRDTMVELGESAILNCSPPWLTPKYEPSKRRLTWQNGAVAIIYSGDEPDQLRGPQHDCAWVDELAKFRYSQETWDNLEFGLRLGSNPQVVVTTTPRPIPIIKQIIADPATVETRGSSYENIHNLAPAFLERVLSRYEGTRLGRQELYAELLDDVPGALWTRNLIEQNRVTEHPPLARIVVGVDPPASTTGECGIVVAGRGVDGKGYVLDDLSISGSPDTWARQVVTGYHKYRADRIAAEVNNGGDMVVKTIKTVDDNVPVTKLWASRGKHTRAEPVAALYEQNRVHHLGMFAELEDEYCSWVPGEGESPNHLDAAVWALTQVMLQTNDAAKPRSHSSRSLR